MLHRLRFLFVFVVIFSVAIFRPVKAQAAVIINEFSSASGQEWVEILNTDSVSAVNLGGYSLSDGSSALTSLSGSVPRQGLLTFALPANSLNDSNGCLVLLNGSTGVFSIAYGGGSCPGGGASLATAPAANESGALTGGPSGSWQVSSPSKGWCNDSYGGCPTISSIVSGLNGAGVSTNLGSMEDYSRASGLYFQKSATNDPNGPAIGKISFLSEMNFTDQDALTWMSSLDTKLDMATRGIIGLDADLIKNVMSTNATLTMYGLTLNNPEILVDNQPDTGNVVSGLTYDKASGDLTFTAAHFTTFSSRERTSSSSNQSSGGASSSGPASPPGCDSSAPSGIPDLFQLVRKGTSATLFFSPVSNNTRDYYISYGFSKGDERFGVSIPAGDGSGVVSYTVNELPKGVPIYFRVQAGNGCATGGWSEWLGTKKSNGTVHRY